MLSRIFGRRAIEVSPLNYDQAKQQIQDSDLDVRRSVARRQDVQPEILYYLAEDEAPSVRQEIAANPAAPLQADLLLARDADADVRLELARKIGRLLPNLSPGQAIKLRELTIETLEMLARDALPIVRGALAEEIKRSDLVPRELVLRLAQDIDSIVSAPVLEYSPLLSELELLDIIRSGAMPERLSAIARREGVPTAISDAVAASQSTAAVAALLANPSAQIREETLDMIAEQALGVEAWHQPLVQRPELSVRAIRRISQFVASSLLSILAERHGLPEDLKDDLRRKLRKRLDQLPTSGAAAMQELNAAERAAELHRQGRLDDECLVAAIGANDREFALSALALAAGLPREVAGKIVESRQGKTITALCWKAGFGMRTAIKVQIKLSLVPPQAVLYARNGVDYPMSDEDMLRHLEFFMP